MPSQELINYISASRKHGIDDDALRLILRDSGWDDTVISQALAVAPQSTISFRLPVSSLFLNKLLSRFSHNKLRLAGVILILFCSGTAFAAYQYYHSPNVLMKRMVGNVKGIKTLHFSFISTYDFTAAEAMPSMDGKIKSSENISGDIDLSDSKNPQFNIVTDVTEKESGQNITDIQAKVLYTNSKLYFNFIKLLFDPNDPDMSSLENTWYFLDKNTLQNLRSLHPDTYSPSSVATQSQSPSLQQTILNNVTDSRKRQLIQAALKYKIFTTIKKPDEKINGVATYHLHYVINQEQTIAFLMEYDKINQTKDPTTKAEWEKIFQDLSKDDLLQGDVWIGKSDLYPYKLVFNVDDGPNSDGKDTIIPVSLTMSNFNKPVTFTPPSHAIDAAPIIRSFLQQQLGNYGNNEGYEGGNTGSNNGYERGYQTYPTPVQTNSGFVGDGHFPALGNTNAKVTVVEFGDLRGSFAKQFEEEVLPEIKKDYIDTGKVQFYFRNYVLLGDASFVAANAAECANEQEKFWNFYTYMYENVAHSSDTSVYTVDNLSKIAEGLGMNPTKFGSCLSSNRYNEDVTMDQADAQRLGVNGSPTLYINGVQLVGAQSYDIYQEQIDKALNGL